MRTLSTIALLAVAALALTAFGLIATERAAGDHASHAAIGAPLDAPRASPAADGKPWLI